MTEELNKKVEELELKIRDMLVSFVDENGVTINDIHVYTRSFSGPTVYLDIDK